MMISSANKGLESNELYTDGSDSSARMSLGKHTSV